MYAYFCGDLLSSGCVLYLIKCTHRKASSRGVYRIYSHNFHTFLPIFSPQNGNAKIMQGISGRRCFRGDFQVRSGIRYPIHKL
jgi:hypothetical protein